MLVTGIILLLIGAIIAYVGRPREPLVFYAGVIIFVIGVVFLIIWAVSVADTSSSVHDAALFAPLAWMLRRMAAKLDGQETAIVPPGGYVFWSYAPSPSSVQWQKPSSTSGLLQDGTPYTLDLN